jgi:DNA modification methylase
MNKLRGEHEIKLDADEIALIFQSDKLGNLAELIAQQQETLENILTKHKGIQFQHEDGFDVDKALEDLVPETKLGDIWQLGQHRIICADCSDERSIKRLMEDKKADMVFTDPPYGVDYSEKNEWLNTIGKGNLIETPIENDKIEDYGEFYSAFLKTLPMEQTNSIYITIAYQQLLSLLQSLEEQDYYFSQLLVWVKNNHVLGRTDYADKHELIVYCWKGKHEYYGDFDTTVWEIDKPLSSRLHPTMKPIELITRAIRNSSKQESLIFDPFLGSGSTLIACEQTNRICYGVEIDPHYVDVCVKRYETYTNNKATKVQEVI